MPENYSDYTVSFNYEQRLAEYDIKGSIAHSRMLAKQNIIDNSDNEKIIKGLNNGNFKSNYFSINNSMLGKCNLCSKAANNSSS